MTGRAIIIGGGPAGCSTAIHLARRGWCCVIVESREFPRRKVCGEFISPAASAVLESLLPYERLVALGARRVSEFVVECGEREARWRMPSEAWVLSRATLDDALLESSRAEGVDVVQPARAARVVCDARGARVELEGGRVLEGEIVVHADGLGRLDAREGVLGGVMGMRRGVVGRKCHVRLPSSAARGGLRMRACHGAYIGMVEVEEGLTTIALVARSSLVERFRGDADAMLRACWSGFDPSWREGEWLSCGVARGAYRRSSHERAFRAGNAAAAVEPVGGEGIGLGLWSGMALADALSSVVTDGRGASERCEMAQRAYAGAYRRRLRLRGPACALAALLLERPELVRAAWPMLASGLGSMVFDPWWRLTGKPSCGAAWLQPE